MIQLVAWHRVVLVREDTTVHPSVLIATRAFATTWHHVVLEDTVHPSVLIFATYSCCFRYSIGFFLRSV
jgi:hypothetical protein